MEKTVKQETGRPDLGKFENAEKLLDAYNALEREFTKRCQLLRQLQAAQADAGAQAEGVPPEDPPEAESAESANAPAEASKTPDVEHESEEADGEEADIERLVARYAGEYAEMLSNIPEVMDACIARYKQALAARASLPYVSGTAVIMPAKRPRTLLDAKRLADEMLK